MKREMKNKNHIDEIISIIPGNEILNPEQMICIRGGEGEPKPILPPPPTKP